LPGEGLSAARTTPASFSADASQAATTAAAASSSPENTSTAAIMPTDSIAIPVSTDMRTRSLERTQDLVTVNAMRLTDSGNNSMQVVIKPDAGTQLSLELRQQNGAVEVQAVLQQGDFNHLNQQWSHLQHSLEQRGIRLAPLTDNATAFTNNSGGEMYQNKQNQTTEGIPQITLMDAPAGITPAGVTARGAKPASSYQGWETWA
jgi:hypothetical protein